MKRQEQLQPGHWHHPLLNHSLDGNAVSSCTHIPAGVYYRVDVVTCMERPQDKKGNSETVISRPPQACDARSSPRR